jgi:alkylated DNA repair dioxygenase AlkB
MTREIPHEVELPPGLKLAYDFVTPDEERALIASIEASGIAYVAYDPGNPRAARTFGWEYDNASDTIYPGDPLPEAFFAIRDRAAAFAGIAPEAVIQGLLLRYDPGSLIQPHCDKAVWDHVIGLSLGGAATMEFRRPAAHGRPDGEDVIAVELPPRSIYLQTGDARHVWQHCLPLVTETRWGITFRDFSEDGRRQRGAPVGAGARGRDSVPKI